MTNLSNRARVGSSRRAAFLLLASAAALATLTGCQAGASAGIELLHLVGIAQKPLGVSHVAEPGRAPDSAAGLINPFAQYDAFHAALGRATKRTVVPDLALPFQIAPNLSLGLTQLAVVTPLQYAQIGDRDRFPVLAVSVDEGGKAMRPALLVVPASSSVQQIGALRGAAVAFGPAGDARAHHAALMLLADNGLKPADLSLSVVPIPGSLRHYPNPRAVAQAVMNNSCVAGFVDEAAWDALPEHASGDNEPAHDRFRVLAKTRPMPQRLVIASPTIDARLRASVTDFLMGSARNNPDALRPLKQSGFEAPTAEAKAAWESLAGVAPESQPSETPATTP